MGKLKGNILFFLPVVSLFLESSIAVDTITPSRSIDDSQTIVSAGHKFELGFFNGGNSNDRYLGIWYKNLPVRTVVWVANRESALVNSSGLLTLGDDGTLSIVNDSRNIIWSSISSLTAKDPVALLLDTGNFVVKDAEDDNEGSYIWQSFDYPSDTLLPGMKLGWNKRTGLNRHLTSWKSSEDPSSGEYTYSVDPCGLTQLVLRKGSDKQFRSGPWYGTQFSGVPVLKVNPIFTPIFVSNADEVYYSYNITANIPSRFALSQFGSVQHLSWNDRHSDWYLIFTVQQDRCDNYGLCGSYGICNINKTPNCDCLKGFEPKLSKDWDVLDWSGGCVRKDQRVCHEGEKCLKNCSCTAYAQLDIKGTGNGCVTWHANTNNNKKNVTIATTISVASAMIILVLIGWFVNWKKKMISVFVNLSVFLLTAHQPENQVTISKVENEYDLELPLVEFATIQAATNNFSAANKIGEGGYGPVYKGELQSGQEVAVKRLAENSGQGLQEFKNEVLLISKLQHRNLVKLLGCCIEREERMLIYEYMPNRSLDSFIFDETRRPSLDWRRRHDIIVGISRGLLYLHRDSRLRIIHRDLKASNVLLDNNMNPKISDFGMERTFHGDQTEANTKRIVGTYGYMPPEYAIDGHFSLKSDVFSFGVILLEMVSGKKKRGFFHSTHKLNLLGHAWKLWNEEKALELVDELMEQGFPEEEAIRCIQVGLLCVQQRPEDRPVMQTVVLMLDSESMTLPQPGRPGFYEERCLSETDSSSIGNLISNEMTVTLLEGR
ncbi:putative S-locus-specific glycoprotein S13 precursor [Hibiscus syriacus]|uniref:Receptor-like serine/threonine-protein kinase n=1 Tax=Hibiscus syriacus TaxID=106335 RepID=A0A6A2ZXJ3_HIBSY|nr:putative S-locus-specific glycoprotein S13 precursor [Hibiscus syriacus]